MIDQSEHHIVSVQLQPSSTIPDRQLRKRTFATAQNSNRPLLTGLKPHQRAMSNSSGYQSRQARIDNPRYSSTMQPYQQAVAPMRTKTGRISKALKGRKVHRCPQCGKVYSRAEHLRRHQNNHEGDALMCKICNKAFFREDLLTRHISKHAGHEADYSRASMDVDVDSSNTYSEGRMSATPTQARESPCPPHLPSLDASKLDVISHPNVSYPLSPARYTADISSYPTTTTSFPNFSTSSYATSATTSSNLVTTTPFTGFVSADSYSAERPLKHQYPNWQPEFAMPSQYPVHTHPPWLPPQFHPPSIAGTVDFTQQYPPVEWQPLVPGQSPVSASPSAWDPTWMDLEKGNVKTSSRASPAPAPAVPPVLLPLSVVNPEDSIQDSQLGIKLSNDRKQAYFNAYWRHFHPQFPIIHRPTLVTYMKKTGGGHLLAAIMAIGAQYSHGQLAGSDSRILHERCEEFIENQPVQAYSNLELMQVIVLVEFLSHFKAKRAPDTLSEAFLAVYDRLWQKHFQHHTRSTMDSKSEVSVQSPDDILQEHWSDWVDIHSRERLLAACFILDSRHALLLGRQSHANDSASGLDFFVPVTSHLWDATTPTRWAQMVRNRASLTITVSQLLDKLDGTSDVSCDLFQSSLIVACYAASTSTQIHTPPAYVVASHPVFELSQRELLSKTLINHPSIQIMFRAAQLFSLLPFRALIATAGESWFFSRKLANDASQAAEEFKLLKTQLRHWTSGPVDTTGFIQPSGTSFFSAISLSLNIIQLAVNAPAPHITLSFGPELAVYVATLVLWAASFSGLTQARATGRGSFSADVDPAEWEPLRAENLVKEFLPHAQSDIAAAINAHSTQQQDPTLITSAVVNHSILGVPSIAGPMNEVFPLVEPTVPFQTAFPPHTVLDSWLTGVGSTMRWTAFILGGSGQRQSGAGEMIEGAIGVLEKLGRSAWVRAWF